MGAALPARQEEVAGALRAFLPSTASNVLFAVGISADRLARRSPPGVKAMPEPVRRNSGSPRSLRSWATCIETAAFRLRSFLLKASVSRQNRFTNCRVVQLNRSTWLVHIASRSLTN